MKWKKTYGYRNKYNTKCLVIHLIKSVQTSLGTALLLKMDKIARDEPQASQVIKSAGCARPHRDNRDGETACQHASAQCVSSLEDRCELKGHIWPVKFSQKERSGYQPGLDTYRCLIRCHPQRGVQKGCHQILSDSRSSAALIKERFARQYVVLFSWEELGRWTVYWGQVCEIKIMVVHSQVNWDWTWTGKPIVRELTKPGSRLYYKSLTV